jgi:hypothetical protein
MESLPGLLVDRIGEDLADLLLSYVPEDDYADAERTKDSRRQSRLESIHGTTEHALLDTVVDDSITTITTSRMFGEVHSLRGRPAIVRRTVSEIDGGISIDTYVTWNRFGKIHREGGLPAAVSQSCRDGVVAILTREWSHPPASGAPIYEGRDSYRTVVAWDLSMGRDWYIWGTRVADDPHAPRAHDFCVPARIEVTRDETITTYTRAVPKRPTRPEPHLVSVCQSTYNGKPEVHVWVAVCIPCRHPPKSESGPHFCDVCISVSTPSCAASGNYAHVGCARAALGVEIGASLGREAYPDAYKRRYDQIDIMCPFRLADYVPRARPRKRGRAPTE